MTPDVISIDNPAPGDVPDVLNRQNSAWDIRNAPRNYISLLLFQIGSAAFSFASVWLVTHYLGSEGYGGIVAIIAASQVAQVLVNWTCVAVVRFGVDEYIETNKIARTFWIRLTILFINLGLVFSLSRLWYPPLAAWLKLSPDAFWPVSLLFAISVIWIHVQMSIQAVKLPRLQGRLQMFERLVVLAGLILLLAAGRFESSWIILSYILGPALMSLTGLWAIRQYVFSPFSPDKDFVWKICKFSLPLLPFSLVGYFSGNYFDAVFVSTYLSTHDLGVYSVATQMNGIAMQIPTLANSLLLPLFITLQRESDNQRAINYFRNVLPSLTLTWGLGCSAGAFAAYFGIPLIFGPAFGPAALSLWILLASSTVALPVAIGYAAVSNATSKTYISLIAALLGAIANIISNFVFIPRYGIAGCALATLIAYFTAVLTFTLLLKRSDQIPFSWTYFGIVPVLAGTLTLAVCGNPWLAFTACLVMSFIIGYWFRASLGKTFLFIKSLGT